MGARVEGGEKKRARAQSLQFPTDIIRRQLGKKRLNFFPSSAKILLIFGNGLAMVELLSDGYL